MGLDLRRYHRQSIRLRGYDYTQNGAYFVTACTWQKECIFGHIENGMMIPSELGNIVNEYWYQLPDHFPNVALDEFAIMPNHVHGILAIVGPVGAGLPRPYKATTQHKPTLGQIVGYFKYQST
ncbi:transposase, partial [Candidatus Acetothermia bacterium]|nr:transposase [Candidatus Acetothermia bacterium]